MGFNNTSHGGWNDKYPDGTPVKIPYPNPNIPPEDNPVEDKPVEDKPVEDNQKPPVDGGVIDNEQNGGSTMEQNEITFESGMDEQAKQSGMNKLGEQVITHDRANDRSQDFYEQLRQQKLDYERRLQEIELASKDLRLREQEQALTERRQVAFNTDLANKQALRHENHGYDKLSNLEAVEAMGNAKVFNSDDLKKSIETIVLDVLKKGV